MVALRGCSPPSPVARPVAPKLGGCTTQRPHPLRLCTGTRRTACTFSLYHPSLTALPGPDPAPRHETRERTRRTTAYLSRPRAHSTALSPRLVYFIDLFLSQNGLFSNRTRAYTSNSQDTDTAYVKRNSHIQVKGDGGAHDRGGLGCLRVQKRSGADQEKSLDPSRCSHGDRLKKPTGSPHARTPCACGRLETIGSA